MDRDALIVAAATLFDVDPHALLVEVQTKTLPQSRRAQQAQYWTGTGSYQATMLSQNLIDAAEAVIDAAFADDPIKALNANKVNAENYRAAMQAQAQAQQAQATIPAGASILQIAQRMGIAPGQAMQQGALVGLNSAGQLQQCTGQPGESMLGVALGGKLVKSGNF